VHDIWAIAESHSSVLEIPVLPKPRLQYNPNKMPNTDAGFIELATRDISKSEPPQRKSGPYEIREVQYLEVHSLVLTAHVWAKFISGDHLVCVQTQTQTTTSSPFHTPLHQLKESRRFCSQQVKEREYVQVVPSDCARSASHSSRLGYLAIRGHCLSDLVQFLGSPFPQGPHVGGVVNQELGKCIDGFSRIQHHRHEIFNRRPSPHDLSTIHVGDTTRQQQTLNQYGGGGLPQAATAASNF
jgi:hypothetical protein